MKTTEFDYKLPPELIAQTPVEPRDASRLMVVERHSGEIAHRRFHDLPQYLQPGDLLVYNESRVIPARLFARKPTGGKAEILLLRPRADDTWEALVGGKRIQPGLTLALLDGPEGEPNGAEAEVVDAGERGMRVLAFDRPVLPLAEQMGTTPLPPYIHSPLRDSERYQTVYARTPGSAAAPTAGLHFTPDLLLQLQELGVQSAFVTLHIGLDTFRPVSEEHVEEHTMHAEYATFTPQTAEQVNQAKREGRRVIAVGTTCVRVLEMAGLRAADELRAADGQADADPRPWRPLASFQEDTNLFIYPGFRFRVVDALITNFHLPRSTLLMLVAAYTGKDLLDRAYAEAIRERYRFYSFGDAMLIL